MSGKGRRSYRYRAQLREDRLLRPSKHANHESVQRVQQSSAAHVMPESWSEDFLHHLLPKAAARFGSKLIIELESKCTGKEMKLCTEIYQPALPGCDPLTFHKNLAFLKTSLSDAYLQNLFHCISVSNTAKVQL